jgi:NAD(P)-dependent dehydrogenase (short-subunit alcohol dehydrogenase family)
MKFAGETALVTGASRGLGRAIALRLATEGTAVGVNYLSRVEEADALVEEIRAGGGRAFAIGADVGDVASIEPMFAAVESQLGPVSVLVNNAGTVYRAMLEDFDSAKMERMRRTNVDGLIQVTRVAARGMKERGYGRIVNMSSIAAHGTALPGNAFYAATKAAVSLLTRRFAMELGPFGITVNAVAPGFILTDLVKEGRTEEEYLATVKRLSEISMMRRTGVPEDIANAVAFLAAREAGFVTAQVITVDGGRMDYIGHT